jgi:hypothetical protein
MVREPHEACGASFSRRASVVLVFAIGCRGQSNPDPTPGTIAPRVPDGATSSASSSLDDQDGDGCPDRMARVPGREEPTVIASFCLDKTEVTVRDYARCVDAGECEEPEFSEDERELATWVEPRRWEMPINYVGPEHITAFCRFIGGRLPTFIEWRWAWDRLSYDRFHDAPHEYRPQGRDDVLPPPPTEPCSEPGDVVGNGICNLGGGWNELVAEPRNEYGFSWTIRMREPARRAEDLRERYPIVSGGRGLYPWETFRCAK